jgi:hypothetical protein
VTSSASTRRRAGRGPGQRRALLLATGELLDQLVRLVGQAHPVPAPSTRTAAGLGRLDATGDERDLDVLGRGQDRGEPVVLGHQHDPARPPRGRGRAGRRRPSAPRRRSASPARPWPTAAWSCPRPTVR